MRRRDLVLACAATLAWPRAVGAQKKTAVIGLLWNDSVKPSPFAKILLDALQQKGWVAGRDFRVEDHVTLEGYAGYGKALSDLLRAKVDVIVTSGATATKAAANATKDIPIVMRIGGDPVASGFAASLARPGGNVTGITTVQVGLNAKRLELLKELLPGASSTALLLQSGAASSPINIRESEPAAKSLNLKMQVVELGSLDDIDGAVAKLRKSGVDAVYVPGSTMLAAHGERLVAAFTKHRLPAVFANDQFTDAGGLLVYSASTGKSFARLAGYVDRVLKGTRPADLAIEQASDVDLVVNLRTAAALGLKVPQSILVRADRVIE
jgi:putative ABC transport system substrate-binding protein